MRERIAKFNRIIKTCMISRIITIKIRTHPTSHTSPTHPADIC